MNDDGEQGSAAEFGSGDGGKGAGARRLRVARRRRRRARAFRDVVHDVRARDIREQGEAIYAEKCYWPEPLIQINPSYKRSTDVGALAESGVVDPGCADIFRANGRPLSLYEYQEHAIAIAAAGESFVVTSSPLGPPRRAPWR